MRNEKWFTWLLILWMGSVVFKTLLYLPIVQYKIQLFDFFFLFFSIYLIKDFWKISRTPFLFKNALFLLIGLSILNLFYHGSRSTIFHLVGMIYSCLIPIVFAFSVLKLSNPNKVITKGVITISILLIATSLGGYFIHLLGISNTYIFPYPNYPYLGDVNRIIGFIGSANQVVFIGAICLFYLLFEKNISRKFKLILGCLLCVILFMTYSKEIILIPAALILTYFSNKKYPQFLNWISCLVFIFFIIALTFFYFSSSKNQNFRSDIIQNSPIVKHEHFSIYPTSYYYLWKSTFRMINEDWLLGKGFGNYIHEIRNHQKENYYPNTFAPYHAHDNYVGLIAQFGIGFGTVLFLFFMDFRKIISINGDNRFIKSSSYFILFYGFIHYTYNLRFMWLFLGLLIVLNTRNTLISNEKF